MLCRKCFHKYYCPYMKQMMFYRQPDDDEDEDDFNDNGYPDYPGESYPGAPGGESYQSQFDFDAGDAPPLTDQPAYEPEETYYLSTKSIREQIRDCRTRWLFFRFKDGRSPLWIYVTSAKKGEVKGYTGRRPNVRRITVDADGVSSVECYVRVGRP